MKKLIAIVLLLLLAACTAAPAIPPDAGATPSAAPPPPPSIDPPTGGTGGAVQPNLVGGLTEVRWLIPVMLPDDDYREAQKRVEEMTAQVNERLREYDMLLDITLHPINLVPDPPDSTTSFNYSITNDMLDILVSDKPYDLISLPVNNMQVSRLIEEKLIKDISGDVLAYPNLAAALRGIDTRGMQYRGGLYGVPTGFAIYDSIMASHLAVRADDPSDVASITDIDSLLGAADAAKSDDKPHHIFFSEQADAYRRAYDAFPFKVSPDFIFLYTQDGGVESYYESDVSLDDIDTARRINAEHRAASALDRFQVRIPTATGEVFAMPYAKTLPADEFLPVKLAPEKPQTLDVNPYGKILNVIPAGDYGLSGLHWLDVLYGDPDIYALFDDGEWLIGSPTLRLSFYLPTMRVSVAQQAPMPESMLHYSFMLNDCVKRPSAEAMMDDLSLDRDFFAYQPMPWDGFAFDPTPVQATYLAVMAVPYGNEVAGNLDIFSGSITPQERDELILRLKEAGLDALLQECRRQYAIFLENKG